MVTLVSKQDTEIIMMLILNRWCCIHKITFDTFCLSKPYPLKRITATSGSNTFCKPNIFNFHVYCRYNYSLIHLIQVIWLKQSAPKNITLTPFFLQRSSIIFQKKYDSFCSGCSTCSRHSWDFLRIKSTRSSICILLLQPMDTIQFSLFV